MNSTKVKAPARNDLTEGPIVKKILTFALPIIAGNLLMQFYNVVDSVVIGQYAGADAVAAVGVSNPIMMLFNALFMGLSMGANIVISQTYGARDMEKLKRSINTVLGLAFAVGILITVMGLTLCRPLLRLLNTPENIFNDSAIYLTVIYTGMLGNVFFNNGSGILRGMGDSRWPLIALTISCVLNIVLDIWFVFGLHWGVAGVAWATVIGQTLSGIVLAWRIHHFGNGIRLSPKEIVRPNKEISLNILRLGLPSGIQAMAMSLGGVITQSFSNTFGSSFIAANSMVMRLDGFAMMPLMGLGMSSTTFVGQNMGAGKPDRARSGVYKILCMVAVVATTMGLIMFFFSKYFMLAFTNEENVIEIAVRGVRVICFVYICMGIEQTSGGAIRGAGVAVVPMAISILGNFLRIPLAYFLAIRQGNYMGMFYAMAATMTFGAIMLFSYFQFGNWREKGRVVARHQPAAASGPDAVEADVVEPDSVPMADDITD